MRAKLDPIDEQAEMSKLKESGFGTNPLSDIMNSKDRLQNNITSQQNQSNTDKEADQQPTGGKQILSNLFKTQANNNLRQKEKDRKLEKQIAEDMGRCDFTSSYVQTLQKRLHFQINRSSGSHNGQLFSTFKDPEISSVTSLKVTSDFSKLLVADKKKNCVSFYDLENPNSLEFTKEIPNITNNNKHNTEAVNFIEVCNDSLFAVGLDSCNQHQWDLETGQVIKIHPKHHLNAITAITSSSDGKYLFTGDEAGFQVQLNVKEQTIGNRYGKLSDGKVTVLHVSDKNHMLYLGDDIGRMLGIDLSTNLVHKNFEKVGKKGCPITGIACTNTDVYACDKLGYIKQFDLQFGDLKKKWGRVIKDSEGITYCCIDPFKQYMMVAGGLTIKLIGCAASGELRDFINSEESGDINGMVLTQNSQIYIDSQGFHRRMTNDGKTILTQKHFGEYEIHAITFTVARMKHKDKKKKKKMVIQKILMRMFCVGILIILCLGHRQNKIRMERLLQISALGNIIIWTILYFMIMVKFIQELPM